MRNCKINFEGLAEASLLQTTRAAIIKMTANANFPNVVPTAANMAIAADNFEAAMADASTGSKDAIANKNVQKNALQGLMRSWGLYVNLLSDGNLEMLIRSGLPLTKEPTPSVLGLPENLAINQAINPGSVEVSFKAVENAISYRYEWAPNSVTANTVWQGTGSSLRKMEISGLEQGINYWFRVRAYGTKKQETVSDEVSEFVMPRSTNKAA